MKLKSFMAVLASVLVLILPLRALCADDSLSFLIPPQFPTGDWPRSLAVADLNGDDIPDLATANFDGANVSVLLGSGDGTFQAAVNYGAGSGPYSITITLIKQIERTFAEKSDS